MSFCHLHNHSDVGSILDGYARVKDLAKRVKALGQPAFALTEHGTTQSLIQGYQAAKEVGVKFIPGIEAYFHPVKAGSRELGQEERKRHYHTTIIAKNNRGYKNLLRLSSFAATEGMYYNAQVDDQIIEEYKEGLILLSGCPQAYIPSLLKEGKYDEAKEKAMFYARMFPDSFYLEVQHHPLEKEIGIPAIDEDRKNFYEMETQIREGLYRIGDELGLPCVCSNDSHYVDKKDAEMHDLLFAINMHKKVDDPERLRYPSNQFYIKSRKEMEEVFSDRPDVLDNTLKIAEECNVVIEELESKTNNLPHFPGVPDGLTEAEYLRQLAQEGLNGIKFMADLNIYQDRLNHELNVINSMGFPGYFLILQDLVKYGESRGILFGAGRGSAASSLVSYSLGITSLDPIHYKLPFSRFLNENRISLPDVDLDVLSERRGEIISYLRQKYGNNNVCQVLTLGTLGCKAALKRVMTAYSISFDVANELTSLIPSKKKDGSPYTIDTAKRLSAVSSFIKEHPELDEVFAKARELEGIVGFTGVHAAGVVISDKPIWEYTAVKQGDDGGYISQAQMDELKDLKLVKFDILGVKTLDVIGQTIESVKRSHGLDIDWKNLPLEDAKTFALYQRGETDGVFQMESSLFKSYLPKLFPTHFDDLSALVALIRPGCLNAPAPNGDGNLVDEYIRRKHGESKITYLHPLLEGSLKDTMGVTIFQESAMKIAMDLADFTEADSDTLRKVIGDKDLEKMPSQEVKFIDGAEKNGISRELATEIFESIKTMANYSFNLSHSACYAYTSYATAYLKANLPSEFMAALLTSVSSDNKKLEEYMKECNRMGVRITSPDINASGQRFVANKGRVLFALSGLKGLGAKALDSIITLRNEIGGFSSFRHFMEVIDGSKVNRAVITALIQSGAFDALGHKRKHLLDSLDDYYKAFKSYQGKVSRLEKKREAIQSEPVSSTDEYVEKLNKCDEKAAKDLADFLAAADEAFSRPEEEYAPTELLEMEKEVLGFYASSHPLDWAKPVIDSFVDTTSANLPERKGRVKAGGCINDRFDFEPPNGQAVIYLSLTDEHGTFRVVVHPGVKVERNLLKYGTPLLVEGTVYQDPKRGATIRAQKVIIVDEKMVAEAKEEYANYMIVMVPKYSTELAKEVKGICVPFYDSFMDCYRLVLHSLEDNTYHLLDATVQAEDEKDLSSLPEVIGVITVKEVMLKVS